MLPFVALPPLMAQVLVFPPKPVKPGMGGKAVVKFRVSQGSRAALRLRFSAFYPDSTGKGPGEPYPNAAFLPPEMLVPPGGRSKVARVSLDLGALTREQKIFICSRSIPKDVKLQPDPDKPTGVATLSLISCSRIFVVPGKLTP